MDVVSHADRQSAPNCQAAEHGASTQDKGPQNAVSTAARAMSRAQPVGKACILLVDDDEPIRETLAELLDIAGFSAVQAGDTAEALKILRRQSDIVALVTDLTMPGEDGIALIRRARELRNDLPAILLTGYAEQETSVATVAGGSFHVLRKPVESDRLIEELQLLLAKPGA